MNWLRGQSAEEPEQQAERPSPAEHERHVEQSEHPGSAPTVPPDTSEQTADETEEERTEPRGEEGLLAARGRDAQGLRRGRMPPRQA